MILPSEYYVEKLYPLQDGVLNILSQSGTDFFLTGGTALSRGYYNHRYSDDLDFFVDNCSTYDEQMDTVFALLRAGGFVWDTHKDFKNAVGFTTMRVGRAGSDVLLKLDFVNDLVPHFGDIQKTGIFYRTDHIQNILSNKLSAIYRYAAKDVADIWAIAMRESINWTKIIQEANRKDAGVDVSVIGDILIGMPQSEFESVAWVEKPDWQVFRGDITRIVRDMLAG